MYSIGQNFFAFAHSAKACNPPYEEYAGQLYKLWDTVVTDYFNYRTGFSQDRIDDRPPLYVTVRDHERDHQMADIDEIVCLRRGFHFRPAATSRPPTGTSIPSAKPDRAPPIKRRRLAFDSTALTDML